ncbi:MAG: hypothetical protein WBW48_17295 [Anaerolineae bacterium]
MDIQITQAKLQTTAEVLTLLRALIREGGSGGDLLIRWLEGMQRDLPRYLGQGTVEMKIGGKGYRVSKEVAATVSQVGLMAEKWRRDSGNNFLPTAVEALGQWLAFLERRISITLTVTSANRGTIEVSVPGYPPCMEHIAVILLTLISLGVTTEEIQEEMEGGGVIRLRLAQ